MKLSIPRVVKDWKYSSFIKPATDGFIPNQYGRRCSIQENAGFWKEAFLSFGLIPSCIEPQFKNFTGNHYLDGAFTHLHTDNAPAGFDHVRCNLMICKPEHGGNPVLDGEEVVVDEGDLWLCIASRERHCSTPIKGGERIIFSFGALIPSIQIDRIINE